MNLPFSILLLLVTTSSASWISDDPIDQNPGFYQHADDDNDVPLDDPWFRYQNISFELSYPFSEIIKIIAVTREMPNQMPKEAMMNRPSQENLHSYHHWHNMVTSNQPLSDLL